MWADWVWPSRYDHIHWSSSHESRMVSRDDAARCCGQLCIATSCIVSQWSATFQTFVNIYIYLCFSVIVINYCTCVSLVECWPAMLERQKLPSLDWHSVNIAQIGYSRLEYHWCWLWWVEEIPLQYLDVLSIVFILIINLMTIEYWAVLHIVTNVYYLNESSFGIVPCL